ncbi:NAD(P)/FAD-dependent oxidoreductase [Microbacterium sp. NPDC076911]|uniref:phytoene desaturase family protein n=1 Tax=Microbacterium sp. NPDC076911 TaxID=3154958 RepID=UPI0034274D4E
MTSAAEHLRVAVIGGGHNGLVSAVTLARAGYDVTVIEQSGEVGGCLWTATAASGARIERGAIDHAGVRPLADELGLGKFGLSWRESDRMAAFHIEGQERVFYADAAQTAAGLGDDEARYLELVEQASALFGALEMFSEPPTPTQLGAMLSRLRGGDDMFRTVLMSAERVIATAIGDDRTRAALEMYAAHSQVPPWAPGSGSMAMLLPGSHGSPAVRPDGGSRALAVALRAALESAGGRVLVDTAVTRIRERDAAVWLDLSTGDSVCADRIISTIDIVRTTSLLEDPPAQMAKTARTTMSGGFNVSEMTVSIARTGPSPELPGGPDAITFIQNKTGDLRRGFGDIVAGRVPKSPWAMVANIPQDDARYSATWISSVVPLHRDKGAWTTRAEERAGRVVVDAVSQQLDVDLAGDGAEVIVSGPTTWQQRIGGTGNPNHTDLTIDQMFGWRPAGAAGHRTEVPWLYLAGAGTHPGGGLSGASGRSSARALMRDLGSHRNPRGVLRDVSSEASGLWSAMRSYLQLRQGSRP